MARRRSIPVTPSDTISDDEYPASVLTTNTEKPATKPDSKGPPLVKRIRQISGEEWIYYLGKVIIAKVEMTGKNRYVLHVDGNSFYYDSPVYCQMHLVELLDGVASVDVGGFDD